MPSTFPRGRVYFTFRVAVEKTPKGTAVLDEIDKHTPPKSRKEIF